MSTTCPNCSEPFSMKEALCHDWRDPERSFGCPHCGTFYVKDMNSNLSESVKSGVVIGGIAVPAMTLFWRAWFASEPGVWFFSGIIVLSTVFLGVYQSLPWGRPLVESEYRPERTLRT